MFSKTDVKPFFKKPGISQSNLKIKHHCYIITLSLFTDAIIISRKSIGRTGSQEVVCFKTATLETQVCLFILLHVENTGIFCNYFHNYNGLVLSIFPITLNIPGFIEGKKKSARISRQYAKVNKL